MITKTQIIKKLKKYGFYSLNRAPYIYDDGEKVGIYFVWPHKFFGNLERVLFFEDEESLEKTIFEYWWFKENKNKYNLDFTFDDYETLTPQVVYKYKDKAIDMTAMKNFHTEPVSIPSKDNKVEVLKRQALMLILILETKLNMQVNNFLEVIKLKETKESLKEELTSIINNHSNEQAVETLTDSNPDSESIITTLKENLQALETKEDTINFIDSLLLYMQNIEMDEGALQNSYLLIKEKYEIEDYQAKIAVLDNIKNKKKLFKNKVNLNELFASIDERSNLKTIVNFNTYLKNEQKRITEIYSDLKNVEKEVIGEYLANFEKITLDVPIIEEKTEIIEEPKEEIILSSKDIRNSLITDFTNLNNKEQSACIVASSFLKDLVNVLNNIPALEKMNSKEIEENIAREGYLDECKTKFQIIADFININIRVKYMKILKIDTFQEFLLSLKDVVLTLNNINFKFIDNFYGYNLNSEEDIISLNLKNIWSKTKDKINIVKVLKNTPLYYSPVIIKELVDVIDSNALSVLEQENVYLYSDNLKITNTGKEIVAVYEKDNIIKDNYMVIVKSIKLNSKVEYSFKEIYKEKA